MARMRAPYCAGALTSSGNPARVVAPQASHRHKYQIYISAQGWRGQRSTTFIGFDHFLFDPSMEGHAWRACFDFVINDFADRTTYASDKEFLERMTTRYLAMQGLQAIMLGSSLKLKAPYGRDASERSGMTVWLRQFFAKMFNLDFPELEFV